MTTKVDIDKVHEDIKEEPLTEEERILAAALADPVRWVESHLRNPDNPSEFIQLRWYQREMIRYQPMRIWSDVDNKFIWKKRKKLYRCGRRIGKSITLLCEVLWLAYTNRNYKVILVTPYEQQMRGAWALIRSLMGDSLVPVRDTEKPFMMEFSNGSTLLGFIGGQKQKKENNRSSPIRSFSADAIGVMEMDHGIDHILRPVLMPIFNGKGHCRWIGDSTPSGQRGLFYQWATDEDKDFDGARDFHFPSSVSPEWNSAIERDARKSVDSELEYEHEYLADWGSLTQGIFKAVDVDEILANYNYEVNYKLFDPNKEYTMGVDWNKTYGVKIFIVERNPRTGLYRTWYKYEVPNTRYTQTQAVDLIEELADAIPFKWIYVDAGYGDTQVELLHKYGLANPSTHLHKILKSIDFKGTVEIIDPATKKKIKKPIKPFCVNNAARIVENHMIIIPEAEDHKNGLAGQMRGYKEHKTPSDNVVFTAENRDDLLVAWMLALLPYAIEEGELTRYEYHHEIRHVADPLQLEKKTDRNHELEADDGRHRILPRIAGRLGLKVAPPLKPIIAGGKAHIAMPKSPPRPGTIQHDPFRRKPTNRNIPSKRTSF